MEPSPEILQIRGHARSGASRIPHPVRIPSGPLSGTPSPPASAGTKRPVLVQHRPPQLRQDRRPYRRFHTRWRRPTPRCWVSPARGPGF